MLECGNAGMLKYRDGEMGDLWRFILKIAQVM